MSDFQLELHRKVVARLGDARKADDEKGSHAWWRALKISAMTEAQVNHYLVIKATVRTEMQSAIIRSCSGVQHG